MECGRFAPSPTGALHLGSARTALAAYLSARQRGARFVLRTEDLDALRAAPGAAEAILSDLRWVGVGWDEGPDVGGPSAPYVQSARRALYDAALESLRAGGWAYPCACSRRDVELAAQAPHGAEPVYPGTCRGRDPDEVIALARARGRGVAWRFRAPPGEIVAVEDLAAGRFAQDVSREVGDFVVYRADGVPAYQLAVVVDDAAMGVTDVVRGEDLLASTPRQLLLYRALGAPAPARYAHVPLVVGDDGARLAKRHGSVSLAQLRERGASGGRVAAALAASLGASLSPPRVDFRAVPRGALALAALRGALPEIGPPPAPA